MCSLRVETGILKFQKLLYPKAFTLKGKHQKNLPRPPPPSLKSLPKSSISALDSRVLQKFCV